MADSIATLDNSRVTGVTEHSFNRRVPGDIAEARPRMIEALERFNYLVLSDDPLHAKRDGAFSMNVLNCALKVTILFRQSIPLSTTVTFNYVIPLSMVTKGDLKTVEREGDALIALATARQSANVCSACGTNNASDSRFCRGCGAPNDGNLPAELEVMRLTAGARAGQQTLFAGTLVMMISMLLIVLPLLFLESARRETIWWVLLALSQVTGWVVLLYGILRLHWTLNPKAESRPLPSSNASHSFPPVEHAELPPQSAQVSITEGTTELLDSRVPDRTDTPVDRASTNTGEME